MLNIVTRKIKSYHIVNSGRNWENTQHLFQGRRHAGTDTVSIFLQQHSLKCEKYMKKPNIQGRVTKSFILELQVWGPSGPQVLRASPSLDFFLLCFFSTQAILAISQKYN